jgi:MFS family permease
MRDTLSKRFDRNDSISNQPLRETVSVSQSQALSTRRLEAARNAVFVVFALNGTAFAAWASRIPDLKNSLDLTAGQLGVTLLALSAGSVVGLPASGWISHRVGAAGAVVIGLVSMSVGMVGIGVGVDALEARWLVMAGLFALGLGMGVWDVGMNLEGASVEQCLGRNIMPRFHAAFSGGTVVSALIGALMAWQQVPITVHLLSAGVLIVAGCVWAIRSFLPRSLEAEDEADSMAGVASPGAAGGPAKLGVLSAWTEPRTLLIGLLTLVAAFTEGTANDWVSVAFVEGYHLPTWAGVLAFATFLSFMTVGRVLGTSLLDRYGRVPVLRVMLVAAGAGSLLVVFGNSALAYLGAAIWGLGVSLGFPVGMSAAADDPARAPARISVVATIGYTAFIAGPPLLGFLGDHYGILRALLAVGAMLLVALLVLPAVREPDRHTEPAGP